LRDANDKEFIGWKVRKKFHTETVVALTKGIFEDEAYDRYPILADALEEEGYSNTHALHWLRTQQKGNRAQWPFFRIPVTDKWFSNPKYLRQVAEIKATGNTVEWGTIDEESRSGQAR
jgi:hypothetical protein